MTKFTSANFTFEPSHIKLRIQRLEGKSVDLDEVAHHESSHQDLYCLQIQIFLFLGPVVQN